MSGRDRLVFTSDRGRTCPDCERPVGECRCRERSRETPRTGGPVRVGRETKGRKGAGVSVVTGLPLADRDLEALARELKAACGAGGTVRDGVIEIQGDHRDRLVAELVRRGYAAKRSGG